MFWIFVRIAQFSKYPKPVFLEVSIKYSSIISDYLSTLEQFHAIVGIMGLTVIIVLCLAAFSLSLKIGG